MAYFLWLSDELQINNSVMTLSCKKLVDIYSADGKSVAKALN